MALTRRKKPDKPSAAGVAAVQTGQKSSFTFSDFGGFSGQKCLAVYSSLREAIPVIDAAINKIVRLTGGFRVICSNPAAQVELDNFLKNVPVGGNQTGIEAFVSSYLDQLLTYGTAVGEIVTNSLGIPAALYNSDLRNVELRRAEDGITARFFALDGASACPVKYPELVVFSVLSPEAGKLYGNSLLRGLPFVSSVLMKIFNTVGINWERLGNVRFAVTYKPQNDAVDKAYAKERAMQVAEEWSSAMNSGSVKDFIAVGDVQIKVIGAENQILDSEIPVRQLLEQIVAKTGLPPFMLGFSWSSTERMSSQQADVLTSELEAYRRIITPVIEKIALCYLRLNGFGGEVETEWDNITLQDATELGRARLYEAQAAKIEREMENERTQEKRFHAG